ALARRLVPLPGEQVRQDAPVLPALDQLQQGEIGLLPPPQQTAGRAGQVGAVLQIKDLDQTVAVGQPVVVNKPFHEALEVALVQRILQMLDALAEEELERLFKLLVEARAAGEPSEFLPDLVGRCVPPPASTGSVQKVWHLQVAGARSRRARGSGASGKILCEPRP